MTPKNRPLGFGLILLGLCFFFNPYFAGVDVLFGEDGKPLALIEAKRTCKDVAVGRQQAKLYADILEKELYNGTISGIQLDGKRYFYVNPLEVNPGIS